MNLVKNGSWTVKETRLRVYGRCFTLKYHQKVTRLELQRLYFVRGRDLLIAMHGPGGEIWLSEGYIPVPIQLLSLNFLSEGWKAIDIHIKKRIVINLRTNVLKCKFYHEEEG